MRIKTKLVLATAALWIVMALALVAVLRRQDARDRTATADATAARMSHFLLTAVSQSMSRKDKGSIVEPILAAVAEVPGFKFAAVTDMEGRPSWSAGAATGAWGGRPLKDLIAAADRSGSASVNLGDGGVAVRLLPNEPSCGACHPGRGRWLGAVAARAEIDPALLAAHWRGHFQLVAVALGLLLAGALASFFFLRRALVEPLSRLADAIGSMSLEDLEVRRLPRGCDDEIGAVADRFNELLDRIGAAEQRTRESELKYRRLFEAAQDGILIIDAGAGLVVDANSAMLELLGRTRGECVGLKPDDLGLFGEAGGGAGLAELASRESVRYDSLLVRAKDGTRLELECTGMGYEAGGRRLIRCTFRDITARRVLEAQLRQSQKMESVGLLAGGIAHDFNNVLTAILGGVHFLLEGTAPDDPRRADVLEIKAGGERAAGLTRQLLAFSRKQPFAPAAVDLNELLRSAAKLLGRLLGEDVRLLLELEPGLPPVRADAGHLEQVLMNLAANARDAMPRGGSLLVKTGAVSFGPEECGLVHEAVPGRFARLSVEDTGTGMDEAVLKRVFDPFFTTKEPGKGTGLGLSVVYGIVKQHGGWINAYSEPGRGAVFHIYLPVDASGAGRAEAPAAAADLAGHGERILLVEDDPAVRGFVARALRSGGYAVVEAGDAEAAAAAFETQAGGFSLLFCDTVLPGKSGPELAAQLLAARPSLRVLMTSGYTDLKGRQFGDTGKLPFIQKPFGAVALLAAVKSVLAVDVSS